MACKKGKMMKIQDLVLNAILVTYPNQKGVLRLYLG